MTHVLKATFDTVTGHYCDAVLGSPPGADYYDVLQFWLNRNEWAHVILTTVSNDGFYPNQYTWVAYFGFGAHIDRFTQTYVNAVDYLDALDSGSGPGSPGYREVRIKSDGCIMNWCVDFEIFGREAPPVEAGWTLDAVDMTPDP